MGGGGTIIIRNKVAEMFDDPLVIGAVPDCLRERLDDILAKEPGTWTNSETRYALHCAGEAL